VYDERDGEERRSAWVHDERDGEGRRSEGAEEGSAVKERRGARAWSYALRTPGKLTAFGC